MNSNAYSRSIPLWKGVDSLDTSPQSLSVVEVEGSYLLPQWLAANEVQAGCAARTSTRTVNTPPPLASIAL
ncbi:hypothetical protein IB229_03670 [Pseudomonas sp. PDM14]|uniref:hypothetical protein n=1 Tax=Pseudomonas sp. PDM14 TaxID=2769288 RepID=UPI001783930A|nr:hypothetical protein [Pseudomonas sp. PDM14]MBD9482057.1 hypothetical protein [Pseudomonas sp. PDM14]